MNFTNWQSKDSRGYSLKFNDLNAGQIWNLIRLKERSTLFYPLERALLSMCTLCTLEKRLCFFFRKFHSEGKLKLVLIDELPDITKRFNASVRFVQRTFRCDLHLVRQCVPKFEPTRLQSFRVLSVFARWVCSKCSEEGVLLTKHTNHIHQAYSLILLSRSNTRRLVEKQNISPTRRNRSNMLSADSQDWMLVCQLVLLPAVKLERSP